VAWDEGL